MARATKKNPKTAAAVKKTDRDERPPKPTPKNKEEQTRLQFPRRSGAV